MSYISDLLCAEKNRNWEEARAIRASIAEEARREKYEEDEDFWDEEEDEYEDWGDY